MREALHRSAFLVSDFIQTRQRNQCVPGFPSRSIIYTVDALSPASLAWRLAITLDLASFAFVTAVFSIYPSVQGQ